MPKRLSLKFLSTLADGVGGWADSGVDPKLYASSLMANAKIAANTKVLNV